MATTAAQVRKQPKWMTLSANGVEIHGASTWTGQGWETVLTAVKGSKVVGVYDTTTWTLKVAGRVVKPAEGSAYDAWLAALRAL